MKILNARTPSVRTLRLKIEEKDFFHRVHKGGLIVKPEHVQTFWELHEAVIGRLQDANPGAKPPFSRDLRNLAVLPDKTILNVICPMLEGKTREELKDGKLHWAIAKKIKENEKRRDTLLAKLKSNQNVLWHET